MGKMPTNAVKLIKEVMSDRKNFNKIIDLITLLDVKQKEKTLHTVLDGVGLFFIDTLRKGELIQRKKASPETEIYVTWINDRYKECCENIFLLLNHDSTDIKKHCVLVIMKFMESEIYAYSKSDNQHFSEALNSKLVSAILKYDIVNSIPEFFTSLWELHDLTYFTLKSFSKCVVQLIGNGEPKSLVLQNAFTLLKSISQSVSGMGESENKATLAENGLREICESDYAVMNTDDDKDCDITVKAISKTLDPKELKKAFGNAWLEFLGHDLSIHLFKSVLILLQDHIIPNFASPCLLADFLTRSFSQGGGIALLSLHGLFVLMNEHNLEYPQFYTHLYGMVHPRIFDAKYQSRFFYLLNLFLSSTHLPAYIVAAFAKRLARLTLVAPTNAQQLLVNFIMTLVERHPSIQVLINRKSNQKHIKNDPFLVDESDPGRCNAMESSLWELTSLQSHYLPDTISVVKNIDKGPKQDITDLLEQTYEDIFENLQGKTIEDVPMNYKVPNELFGGFEDTVLDLWSV